MPIQGRPLEDFQIHLIVSLLARTNMSFNEIAQRRGVTETVVAAINRKYEVRDCASFRNNFWTLTTKDASQKAS